MTKELFVSTLKFIQKKTEQDCRLSDLLEEMYQDGKCNALVSAEACNLIIHLLEDAMHDEDNDIAYFLYQAEALFEKDLVISSRRAPHDHGKILYNSPETLYDYLVKQEEKRHESSK